MQMIDPIEAQREYVRAMERGYGFTLHHNFAHYLFRRDQIEPKTRERLPAGHLFIWTLRGQTLESGSGEPWITPCDKALDWTRQAHSIAAAIERGEL